MASLLRSRSALQRASSALRARVVGVRPVPAFPPSVFATACSTRGRARAVPRRRRSGHGHRIARPCSHLFPAPVAAQTWSPPRPRAGPCVSIARGVVGPLGFLAVWANSQKTVRRVSFWSRGETTPTRHRRTARRFERTPVVHARATDPVRHSPPRPRSDGAAPSRRDFDRATISAGLTATSSRSSWMAWRRTCRKA